MNYTLIVAFSFSITGAAVIACIRAKKVSTDFIPFLLTVSLAFFNEVASFIISKAGYSTNINNNIYILLESLLITWQFQRWGLFERGKKWYYGILIFYILFWTFDFFIIHTITYVSSYFRIAYSYITVIMSISIINRLIIHERACLLKNSIFLVCFAFIIYYTYKVLLEVFWVNGLNASRVFRMKVYDLYACINLFANLIYALAVLWMPRKLPYIRLL